MQKHIDVKKIREILSRGNTAEVKQNKTGNVMVIEVTRKTQSVTEDN